MKKLALIVSVVTATLFSFGAKASVDFSGVTALADRLGGTALTSKVTFTEWEGQSTEKAQIIPGDGAFTIMATSVHAASLALGTYLRDVAKGHVSWCGKRMPTDWALPTATIDVAPRYPHAMAYNYCTLSYTMAYWSKEAWQNEIDRLALSGYTTALCMAGVQKIWKLTMEELGYTKQQQQDFIVDDAQQAWWLMGNLQAQGNATPQGHFPIVSDEEIETDAEIGKFIVAKMREVGVEPVLQGFIGLVPSSTTKDQLVSFLNSHPDVCTKYGIADTSAAVKIFVTGSYNEGHKSPDLVDPNCTMFQVFSDVWNKNLKAAYGMDDEKDYPKFLGGDLFHENSPPSSMTETEKNNCAKFVQKYQQDAFPGVTWVLQNWQSAPVQDLRNGLDPEHTIIQRLDQSMNATDARTASYVNYKMSPAGNIPWVWVEVMNFGGNTGMHGAFRRFRNVGNLGGNASFKGYGLLSEGLETNPVSYDMYHWAMAQSTQDKQNIDDDELEPWLDAYRQRRYGYTDDNLKAAHTILANTVWTCKQDQQGTMESVFCAKPAYNVTKVSAWGPTTGTPYDRKELIIAAEYFLETAKAHPELLDLETFRYDFVEIFQQILADKAREMLPDCATSQKRRDEFRQMLVLLDSILACSNEWRLDAKEARLVGKAPTTGPSAYRRLITTWTPGGRHQTQLSQYAHRSYAGLVKNYYAKKWNAFFDVTEGTMSQAAYNTLCDTLDEEFPTAELPATPTDGNPVAIAEEILALIAPPAITWTGATDSVWEHTNWNDAKGQAVEWENGKSVILSGFNKTITTAGAITVGNIALENSAVNADNQGWIDPTTAIVIAASTTIEEAYTWDYTGIMSGGWFGSPVQRQCAATGYHKSGITTTDGVKSFTIQFQAIDFSDNVNWLKAVSAKIYQDGADVKIVSTGTGVVNGGALGSGPLSGGSAPASSSGYCIKQIVTHRPSVVTVEGPVAVEGEITLNDGEALALPGATAIDTLSLEKGTATLGLGATQDLAINVALLGSDAKLVLTGSAPTLMGAAGATKVKLPKTALPKVVYVGPDGEEQALRLDTEGYLKAEFVETTISQWIPKAAISTGIKGLTLAELAEKGILSAKMDGGYVALSDVNAYCGKLSDDGSTYTVQMQTIDGGFLKVVALEFTVADGELKVEAKWIRNRSGDPLGTDCTNLSNYTNYGNPDVVTDTSSNGYGIYDLTITPAVARLADGTKFASLTSAITVANGTQKVALLDDAMVTTAINNSFKTWIEIPRGLTLTATCGDFIWWDKAYTLDIYGMLDLGGNALSVGTTKNHVINLYAGGEIKSTNAKGLAIFAANTAINVKANDGFEAATLNTPVQARENTTIAVEADVTAVLNGNIVLKAGGESGVDNPVVTKTGAGTLEFNGVITTGATLVLSEGTLKRVMPVGDTLVVTVNGGTTDVTADNEDAKIVESIDGAVHTFTCIERPYRYRVTEVGEISVNMPGTNYETLAEALDAAKALQDAHPGEVVNIWVISQEVETLAQADLAAWNAANGTSMTLFGDGNGIALKGWYLLPRLYYTSTATEWRIDTLVSNTKNGEATVATKAGDIVTFDKGGEFGPIYIHGKPGEKVPVAGFEVLSGTLKVGYEGGFASIPEGWVVTVADGAAVQFDNWANDKAVKVMDATFNGEGAVRFGETITAASPVTFGTIKGEATITVKAGITVNATSIANPVVLEGGATVKAKNAIADISVSDKNYLLSETVGEDGVITYATKHCIFWTAEEWSSKANPDFRDADGNSTEYVAGDTVVVKTTSGGVMWVGANGVGVPFIIDGYETQIENVDKGRASFKDNDVYLVNGAKILTRSRWNGVKLENTTIHLESGTAFQQYTSWPVTVEIAGTVTFDGAGSVSFGVQGVKFATAESKLIVPETAETVVVAEKPEGYKVVTTTADGVTTYALESYDTTRLVWSSGTLWKSSYTASESPVAFKDMADNIVSYSEGKIVVFKQNITPWLADAAAGKPLEIDGCTVTLMNEGSSGNSFNGNAVSVINCGIVEFQNRWGGTPIVKGSTITVASGATLRFASSYTPAELLIEGDVVISGAAADITIPKFELKAEATLKLPTDEKYAVITTVDGKKVQSESADGVTTYTLVPAALERWEDVDATTTLAEVVPEEQVEQLENLNITPLDLAKWAKVNGIAFAPATEIDLEAYAMNCAPDKKDETAGQLKVSIEIVDGEPVVTKFGDADFNIKPVFKGSTDLKTWHDKTDDDTFFKAVIEL